VQQPVYAVRFFVGSKTPYCATKVLTSSSGLASLKTMALRNVAVNLLDQVPTVVAEPERKKPRSKGVVQLSATGSLPEIKDEDLQRFKRQNGLWF
jgi:hypothetical protein